MTPPTRDEFERALQTRSFRPLSDRLVALGYTQAEVYLVFDAFRELLFDEGRDADGEYVEDGALELIWGQPGPGEVWFTDTLTNDQLGECKKASTKPLRPAEG